MKELRNNIDKDLVFTELKDAKEWYYPKNDIPCNKDEFLEENYDAYCKQFLQYKEEIRQAQTLDELAVVLNRYTDVFSDGRENIIIEI